MVTGVPKILIVDDIEVNLILLETLLRRENVSVYTATAGIKALELAAEHEFALILLDVSMPVLSGYQLAEKIRQDSMNIHTPIIFISAILYDQQSIKRGYEVGAVDYLTKPFQNDILLSKVRIFTKLYQQNKEIQLKSTALNESVVKYKQAEAFLQIKYSFEKAVSLASARFSGNFDIESSIEFMLRDLIALSNASTASMLGFIPDMINMTVSGEVLHQPYQPHIIDEARGHLLKVFRLNKQRGDNLLLSLTGINGPWKPLQEGFNSPDPFSLAIPVNLADEIAGCLILSDCSGLADRTENDLRSFVVFGTIAGNALERSNTRRALELSEENYRSYIQNAPDGILVIDPSGKIKDCNPAAADIFEIPAATLSGIHLLKPQLPFNMTGIATCFNEFTRGNQCSGEFYVQTETYKKTIKAGSTILPGGDMIVFCTDISAEREMEKHLIHNERMVGIGEMATGIAHEINQPLNTIAFGIDNLITAIDSGKADAAYIKEKSRKLFDSIDRMRNIIDHVRTFSRSNDDYIPTLFSVNESINNALSLVNEQYRTHGIEFITNLSPDEEVMVQGNTYKIEQVMLNLLSNARDAIEEKNANPKASGEARISISSKRTEAVVIIEVEDTGKGIDPAHMAHLTTPFYTTKETGKGTGLGLAISYGIIKDHKGSLNFYSEPGQGTRAEIVLPLYVKSNIETLNA
ncbi:MAG: response regulator [Lentimicrobium sp.]|nr:response regulator [Lentimicrobium sp.]